MTSDRCGPLRRILAAALIVLAAAPACAREFRLGPDLEHPPWLDPGPGPGEPPADDTPAVAWAREAARITDTKATQELEMLANRPDIAAAFARYREAGGLVPRLRFAAGYANSEGFTTPSQPLTPWEEEKLRTGPLAFDLACMVLPESSGARKPRDEGDVSRQPGQTLQVSVDVPAGVLRVDRS